MMQFRILKIAITILFIAAVMLCIGSSRAADLVYRQNFGWNDGRAQLSSTGWEVLVALKDGSVSTTSPSAYYVGIVDVTSAPADASNVNAGSSVSDTNGAVRIYSADNRSYEVLAFTEQYPLEQSVWKLDIISFYAARSDATTGRIRVAIRIRGIWYVGDEKSPAKLNPNEDNEFAEDAHLIEVDANLENWHQLTAEIGAPFTIAETPIGALPKGNIEAFGVFTVPSPGNGRMLIFDTYSVTASAAQPSR